MIQPNPTSSNWKRWEEITEIWRDNRWLLAVAGWLLGLFTFPLLNLFSDDLENFIIALVPQAIGVAMTVFILDRIIEARTEHRTREALKKRLVDEAASSSIATAAVNRMRTEGWLTGRDPIALLKGAFLLGADLQGARFYEANLREANLGMANLKNADLMSADLHKAVMFDANLQGATLEFADLEFANLIEANLESALLERANLQHARLDEANLQRADLYRTNLQNANLQSCNLEGANLISAKLENADLSAANLKGALLVGADLRGVNLEGAQFDEKTALPEAENIGEQDEWPFSIFDKYWTPEIDMRRYTDPTHPEFKAYD